MIGSDIDCQVVAVVTGRGGKAIGKNKQYFNICNIINGGELGIHLDKAEFQVFTESVSGQGLNEQRHGERNDNVELVQVVFIPIEHHSDPEVLEAKQKELENWTNDLSDGLKCVKARLVIRGFEEDEKSPVDSPTASKSSMKIFFAVCANNNWVYETMDIKAVLHKGKVVYGLCDASRQWYFSVTEELCKLGVSNLSWMKHCLDGMLMVILKVYLSCMLMTFYMLGLKTSRR